MGRKVVSCVSVLLFFECIEFYDSTFLTKDNRLD